MLRLGLGLGFGSGFVLYAWNYNPNKLLELLNVVTNTTFTTFGSAEFWLLCCKYNKSVNKNMKNCICKVDPTIMLTLCVAWYPGIGNLLYCMQWMQWILIDSKWQNGFMHILHRTNWLSLHRKIIFRCTLIFFCFSSIDHYHCHFKTMGSCNRAFNIF